MKTFAWIGLVGAFAFAALFGTAAAGEKAAPGKTKRELTLAEWVKSKGLKVNEKKKINGQTLAHDAASDNRVDALEWLKAQGADVNARCNNLGSTPMHFASTPATMGWLKANGADVNVRTTQGVTPMHLAARWNQVARMAWLKGQGADVNAEDTSGKTPLHYARNSRVGVSTDKAVEWLIANGAK